MGFEQRCLPLRTAYLGAGLPDRGAASVNRQLGRRYIDQDAVGFYVLGQPAHALQVDAQLLATHGRADVQLGNGPRSHHSIGLQRMLGLEAFIASTSVGL